LWRAGYNEAAGAMTNFDETYEFGALDRLDDGLVTGIEDCRQFALRRQSGAGRERPQRTKLAICSNT
jgi:hypothetical protein